VPKGISFSGLIPGCAAAIEKHRNS